MNQAEQAHHSGQRFDFANILFAGSCNQRCPYCIGRQLPAALQQSNLDEYPLQNLDTFVGLVNEHRVRQVTFTGTNTDPLLYRHQVRLIHWLRRCLPGVQISLHTNGQSALHKLDVLNTYDKMTISFPSFDPTIFFKMTSTQRMPDLAAILDAARIPVKVSCLINEHNADQIDEFLARCRDVGVRRLAIRQLYGDDHEWQIPPYLRPVRVYRNNPVYDLEGMEVTYWRFEDTTATALNLFADGTISTRYLLTKVAKSTRPLSLSSQHLPKQRS